MLDLSVPGVCRSDDLDSPRSQDYSVFQINRASQTALLASMPSGQVGDQDDCFCCCSHILPTIATNFAQQQLSIPLEVSSDPSAPVAMSTPPYHPPRSA